MEIKLTLKKLEKDECIINCEDLGIVVIGKDIKQCMDRFSKSFNLLYDKIIIGITVKGRKEMIEEFKEVKE